MRSSSASRCIASRAAFTCWPLRFGIAVYMLQQCLWNAVSYAVHVLCLTKLALTHTAWDGSVSADCTFGYRCTAVDTLYTHSMLGGSYYIGSAVAALACIVSLITFANYGHLDAKLKHAI
jgi:hypothetical protein